MVGDLRAIGASVKVVSQYGIGFDLLVGYRGANYILEVKQPGQKEALTANEWTMQENWRGSYMVVDSAEDFENMTNLVRLLGDDYLEADFPLVIDKYRIGVVTGRLRPPIKNSNYEVFYKHEN